MLSTAHVKERRSTGENACQSHDLFLLEQTTAVLSKIPHSNCCKRVPNQPLRPRSGRFGTLPQHLEYGIFYRTAVGAQTQTKNASRPRATCPPFMCLAHPHPPTGRPSRTPPPARLASPHSPPPPLRRQPTRGACGGSSWRRPTESACRTRALGTLMAARQCAAARVPWHWSGSALGNCSRGRCTHMCGGVLGRRCRRARGGHRAHGRLRPRLTAGAQ